MAIVRCGWVSITRLGDKPPTGGGGGGGGGTNLSLMMNEQKLLYKIFKQIRTLVCELVLPIFLHIRISSAIVWGKLMCSVHASFWI